MKNIIYDTLSKGGWEDNTNWNQVETGTSRSEIGAMSGKGVSA